MNPISTPTRRLAAGLGLGAISALALATPAAANEFPPNPAAEVAVTCAPQGGFAYTLTNVGGHTPADIAVAITTVDGTGTTVRNIGVDEVFSAFAPVPEDTEATITVSSQYMAEVTLTETIDCLDAPTATVTLECDAVGVAMDVRMQDPDDALATGWEVVLDGETTAFSPGDQFTQIATFEEGDAWDLRVLADGAVVLEESGVVDCVQPTAEIELACTTAGPELVVRLGRDDVTRSAYDIAWPVTGPALLSGTPYGVLLEPGTDAHVETRLLDREVDYRVAVSTAADGEIAFLEGSSGCPETDVVVQHEDVTPVATEWAATDGATTWSDPGTGTRELARTGAETPWLVGTGAGLLALGAAALRLARRLA